MRIRKYIAHVYARMRMCAFVHVCVKDVHTGIHVCVYARLHVRAYISVCTYIYIYGEGDFFADSYEYTHCTECNLDPRRRAHVRMTPLPDHCLPRNDLKPGTNKFTRK